MNLRTIIMTGLGASILLVGGGIVPIRAGVPQQVPKEQAPSKGETPRGGVSLETKRPEVPPTPDDTTPADEGVKPYLFSADQRIELFELRVQNQPNDADSHRRLGEAYEQKAKEKGDLALFAKAEASLRKSVGLRNDQPRAEAALAAVLCCRHKFSEALGIARKLSQANPKDADALATLSDAYLELGRYTEAEESLARLQRLAPLPEVVARRANFADLTGHRDEAIRLMHQALDVVRKTRPAKAAGWYQARLGDLLFDSGKIDEADAAYRAVPEGIDAFHDATFGQGKVLAARVRFPEAIEQVKKAITIGPDLHMLAMLGDLYATAGDAAKAEEAYRRLEREAPSQAEHSRDLANFYADHDRNLPKALELARREITARQDVFTRDALAWALLKNDLPQEAAREIAEALKVGTKDAKIYYHAGMIHRRLGDEATTRAHLGRALEINPYFSVLGAAEARGILAPLSGKVKGE